MPSDFHPLFLFLGNSADLAALADLLHRFADEPRRVEVRRSLPEAGGRSQLTIVPGEGPDAPYGVRETPDGESFTWMLNAWQADQIATRIESLTASGLKSGNDIIELGLEGEIPVKVSKGEFTDNFLTPSHHLDPDYEGPVI
ncbi:hypothetical protein QFW96_16420 [Saccharopolyspora sp. TS4A08]|uniref:VOC family protein n=1 Tax=Saccharopolyspora ipomoeae TaxID=3042027 RepID=A0ABT6PQE0_9PSEU|nr:hypothetical protein [Saccharopolyspora sp. TS4A08]MDI2030215.1 hypothetical protein [Saccharopolyspora sp. TS4A08]